jgi:hypothetical protein
MRLAVTAALQLADGLYVLVSGLLMEEVTVTRMAARPR